MTMVTDVAIRRIDALIKSGEELSLAPGQGPREAYQGLDIKFRIKEDEYFAWRTQAISALVSILGELHTYTREFRENIADPYDCEVEIGVALLKAIKSDLENGYLLSVEQLIAAEVFSDFLEMAEHLMDNGYKDPAASLCGAVLEDSLRRITSKNGITFKKSDGLSS